MTINLPTLTASERGKIFTFVKLNTYNFDVVFNTSSGQWIFSLNNITGTPTTNTTIFPSNKKLTKLAVGWFGGATYWIEVSDYSTFDVDINNSLYARLASPNAFTNTNTFNSFLPTSTITASLANELVNFTCLNAQSFVKPSFNNVWTGTNSFNSFLPTSTITASSNNELVNFTCLNGQSFVKPSFNNVWTGTNTFNSFLPTSTLTPSSNTQLITKIFADQTYIDFTTDQTITGTKRLSNFFCTALNITPTSGGSGNRQQVYMTGTELAFVPQFTNNNYAFYCKDSVPTQTKPLNINSVSTTINNLLVSNNITAPSSTINGINNIYTNLSLDGGIINVGARGSNINIKCNLNIVESVYGTTPTKITTINQEGDSCRFTNNGSTNGDFIFEINESGTYNPLVINKTSVNIAGDALVFGDLILYDTTPSTKNVIIGMVGNDLFFTPSINAPSSSYNFKVNDSASTITTPLIINSTNTTIANNLISNSQATFSNFCPKTDTDPAVANDLVKLSYLQNNFVDRTNNLSQNINGVKTFTETIYVKDFRFNEVGGSANTIQAYLSGTDLNFISINVNNNRYFFNTKDGAGNPTNPLIISSTSTTISNNLVSNNLTSPTTTSVNNIYRTLVSGGEVNFGGSLGVNNIFGQTFFNSLCTFNLGCSFLGSLSFNNGGTFSEIEQTSGSNLVIKNYTNSRDIILSTKSASTGEVDSLKINTTSCDILSPTLNLTSSSTINILSPNNLSGVINFLSTLTTATINFCSTAYTSIFNLNARLAHKQVQYMNEVKTISGTSITLTFPLEQTWMFTSTGATAINVTLPTLTASYQAGFNFIFFKTASNTNSVIFTRGGSNTIRGLNSITDVTNVTRLSGTNSVGVGFYTAEVSAGNFAWISY